MRAIIIIFTTVAIAILLAAVGLLPKSVAGLVVVAVAMWLSGRLGAEDAERGDY